MVWNRNMRLDFLKMKHENIFEKNLLRMASWLNIWEAPVRIPSKPFFFFFFFVYYCNCLNCWSAARIIALLKRISKNEWLQTLCVLTTWLERSVSWRPNLSPFFLSFFFLFPFALASPVRDQSGVSDWAKGQWIEVAGSLSASGAKSNHYAVYVNKETTRTFDSSFYVL